MKKTILSTGTTDGIGLLAAKKLAEQGYPIKQALIANKR